jgi:lauroyl/myristoyl acyltransferase
MKKSITNIITVLHLQYGDDLLPITVFFNNESKEYDYHIAYPKIARRHYYSMLNEVCQLFIEQFPNWYSVFHYQQRGEYHKIVIPNY